MHVTRLQIKESARIIGDVSNPALCVAIDREIPGRLVSDVNVNRGIIVTKGALFGALSRVR